MERQHFLNLDEGDQPEHSIATIMPPITSSPSMIDDESEDSPIHSTLTDTDYFHPAVHRDLNSSGSLVNYAQFQDTVNTSHFPSSSTYLQTELSIPPQLTTPSYPISIPLDLLNKPDSDPLEPHCTVCNRACSRAHSCPDCSKPVHVICGHAVEGTEGFGSPVYCNSCWLNKRESTMQINRKASKRGQSRQIDRMVSQSVKKVRIFDVGDNIL